MPNIIMIILLVFCVVMIITLFAELIQTRKSDNYLAKDVRDRFGITITTTQADLLNDHRSGVKENILRVGTDQVLVKAENQPVELRKLS